MRVRVVLVFRRAGGEARRRLLSATEDLIQLIRTLLMNDFTVSASNVEEIVKRKDTRWSG